MFNRSTNSVLMVAAILACFTMIRQKVDYGGCTFETVNDHSLGMINGKNPATLWDVLTTCEDSNLTPGSTEITQYNCVAEGTVCIACKPPAGNSGLGGTTAQNGVGPKMKPSGGACGKKEFRQCVADRAHPGKFQCQVGAYKIGNCTVGITGLDFQ